MWHSRPLKPEDIPAVARMVAECEMRDSGQTVLDAADIVTALNNASEPHDAVVVVQNSRIVGWGAILLRRARWADVHPDARGRKIGTWLVKWSQWRAELRGSDRMGQTIDDRRTDVAEWFESLGYRPRYHSWLLQADLAALPAPPEDVDLGTCTPGELDAALDLLEAAFRDFSDRQWSTREDWQAMVVDRPGFDVSDLLVARRDGRLVGTAFVVAGQQFWLDSLGVAAEQREHGVGTALLAAAGARARAAGYQQLHVSTDSRGAALDFYRKRGMNLTRSFTHYAIDLPPHP